MTHIGPIFGQNPNAYAKVWANQNGLSADKSKERLGGIYGEAKAQNDESIFTKNSIGLSNNSQSFNFDDFNDLDDINSIDASSGVGFMNFIKNLFGFNNASSQEQQNLDPDTVAQKYADTAGITLDEAKEKLSAQFGEPQQPSEASEESGMPSQSKDPDTYAQEYATKNNITLEEAKAELLKLYGEPKQQNQ